MAFDEQRALLSATGATLNLYVKKPVGKPRAVVQVSHGLAEHAARYGRFAGFLAGRGFATYAHDHRGHGFTTTPDAPPRSFAREMGVQKVVADVAVVHDLIAAENPDVPVVAFGHSMGGLIALNFVLAHPRRATAVAIWNANFSAGLTGHAARALLAWERFRLGSDMPSLLLPRLTFAAWATSIPGRRTDFDWLSHDAGEVDAYIADPLCGWAPSVSMWQDIFRLIFRGADDRNFADVPKTLPFHLVGGEEDPATEGGAAVRTLSGRLAAMGFSNPETRIYAGTRHESLNELNRNLIMADFVAWLDATLPPCQ
jgi:alpha-beta hydrolase superfamily lysophospholipase